MATNIGGKKAIKSFINGKAVNKIYAGSSVIFRRFFTITWKWHDTYNTWETATEEVEYGHIPSRSAPDTVTNSNSSERLLFNSWDDLSAITSDRVITATYDNYYYYKLNIINCTVSSGDEEGWYAEGTITSTVLTANTNWSWYDESTSEYVNTKTVSGAVPRTVSESPDYVWVTYTGERCTRRYYSGINIPDEGTWRKYGQTAVVSWFANEGYAFDSSGAQRVDTYEVHYGPENVVRSCNFGKMTIVESYSTLSSTNYKNNNYYDIDTTHVVHFTADNVHSFMGSEVSDDGVCIGTVPGTFTITPAYTKISVAGLYTTINITDIGDVGDSWTGIVANGSVITWSADENYHFGSNNSTTVLTDTVIPATTEYNNPAVKNRYTITWKWKSDVDSWETATQAYVHGSTPSRALPDNVISGNTRFRAAAWDDLSAVTENRQITCQYVKEYYVNIESSANCSANYSDGEQWIPDNTTITFTTTTATSSIRYSFDGSISDDYTKTVTIDSSAAGTTISSGTVYKYYHATSFVGLGCSTNATAGWYIDGSMITWTADNHYHFGSSNDNTLDITNITSAGKQTNTANIDTYTIKWKYRTGAGTATTDWTTTSETLNYNAVPSRELPDTVTASATSYRLVPTDWDDLSAVTQGRTITAVYKTQYYVYITAGTNCTADKESGFYDDGATITFTTTEPTTSIRYSFSGSISNEYTNQATVSSSGQQIVNSTIYKYYNVTNFLGNNCSTTATAGWYADGASITWVADNHYHFESSNENTLYVSNITRAGVHAMSANPDTYTIKWKYRTGVGSSDWDTASETYTYGSTPSRTLPDTVTASATTYRYVATNWDDLGVVTQGRTITAQYKTQYYSTITAASNCTSDLSSGFYDLNTDVTFTTTAATSSIRYSFDGSVSNDYTKVVTIETANQAISSGTVYKYYNITQFVGNNCSTTATTGWYVEGTSIAWTADDHYHFGNNNENTLGTTSITSSGKHINSANIDTHTITWKYLADYIDSWTTASETYNYGSTPSRSAPATVTTGNTRKVFSSWDSLATVTGARTITATYTTEYYVNVGTGSNYTADYSDGWQWLVNGTVITFTTTAATSSIRYSFSGSVSNDYIKTSTISSSSAGNTVSGGTVYKYYNVTQFQGLGCSTTATTGWYVDGSMITWTADSHYHFGTDNDNTLDITNITSSGKHYNTANPDTYTIKWKYMSDTSTWTTASETYTYGATPSRTLPATVTYSSTTYRYVATSWDDLSTVTQGRTITAQYKTQYYVSFSGTNCSVWYTSTGSSSQPSDGWFDSGITLYWRVSDNNRAFDSNGTGYQAFTISTYGTQLGNPGYYYLTISGINCTPDKSSGWYAGGTSITWTADTGYGFSGNSTTSEYNIYSPGSWSKTAEPRSYTIQFSGTYGSWNNGSPAYSYYGDAIQCTGSGRSRTITCYEGSYSGQSTAVRWTRIVTWPEDNSSYTYTNFSVSYPSTVTEAYTITESCTRTAIVVGCTTPVRQSSMCKDGVKASVVNSIGDEEEIL